MKSNLDKNERKMLAMDTHKRWGNSAVKGHGVNSPAMMAARAGFAKNKAIHAKMGKKSEMYTSPTGSKHKVGSNKHSFWMDIERKGREDKKYGAGD